MTNQQSYKALSIRAALLCTFLAATQAGCTTAPSSNAICDATKDSRTAHAGALYEDGGSKSVMTGAYLIAQIDVGCAK